uniref:Retrovirus-related Pol polyprotein from transposon TNT 1-94 n=1 Tax=Fagus sylvatica TaxID=28930 RepID=A0A2N9HWL8_FAGSY
MDLVDRSTQPPEMFLHDANGNLTSAENNLYKPWKVRDQAIKTLINATLSSSALSLVMKQITARDVWKTLERRYTSLSRTHVLSLKAELDRVRKNNYTMTIYLDRVKEIRDKLSFVGVEIDDEELLHVVLKGLPPEYDAFCSVMRTRDKSLSCEDLHVLLTSEEESKKNAKSIAHELQHMAMAATRFKGPPTTNTPLPLFSGFWNRGRGGHSPNYRGRGRGGSQSSRGGHTALELFHRMNFAYQGRQPPVKLAAIASTNMSQGIQSQISTQSPYPTESTCWISDSGATDHFTPNITHMPSYQEYQGQDGVTDNNASFYFDASKFRIQDLPTGNLLYSSLSENGLYPIRGAMLPSSSSVSSCFSAVHLPPQV